MTLLSKEILSQHVAVLGKTGSGKTSTAKLAIEQVVADGSRVCVLDPIKSDWWGLTSSADGKRAGLPFHILGGPRGHVPLHASAGKAIGEIVANGALPLSIIDMADFEPGGQAKFFTEFAPTLLRKMRGVVYLVIEEAHLFAPKERSGIGAENLSIHWAKTLATAGRSKGVRLVLVTQRTQALHNALLGSCDTMIAHRLTAPADQEPVVKWLKANTSKDVLEQVSSSLASLKTGDAWLCSGEAKRFEVVHFPRISTYDNTATPTGDGDTREIKTAAVDQEKLRAIIGDAVEKAKADDPRELRRQIADLKTQISKVSTSSPSGSGASAEGKEVEVPALTDKDRQILATLSERLHALATSLNVEAEAIVERVRVKVASAVNTATTDMLSLLARSDEEAVERLRQVGFNRVLDKLSTVGPIAQSAEHQPRKLVAAGSIPARSSTPIQRPPTSTFGEVTLGKCERAILTVLAQIPDGATSGRLTLLTRYRYSGVFKNSLSVLRQAGFITGENTGTLVITDAGVFAIGRVDPLPTGRDLAQYWLQHPSFGKCEAAILEQLLAHPKGRTAAQLCEATNYQYSGGFKNSLSVLRTAGVIVGRNTEVMCASEELF